MTRKHTSQNGITLIEALVAMAVMAFGILGVVGVQATLRFNADVAKQRAEAVRIAQAEVEAWRGFTVLTMPLPPDGHTTAFADIQSGTSTITGTSNTSFTITRTVSTIETTVAKAVRVEVAWNDRVGNVQSVVLNTQIAGALPEVSGSLSVAAKSLTNAQVRGRNVVIPPGAVDLGNGTSSFTPPGAPTGVSWVFNNVTGLIVSICTSPGTCATGSFALLSGFVRFALTTSTPVASDAEIAPGPAFSVDVQVNATAPTVTTVSCFDDLPLNLRYYCAVPLASTAPFTWSGSSVLTSFTPISGPTDNDASHYIICRYTPENNNHPAGGNAEHPLNYTAVATSLSNQNFLVIRAGNGTGAQFTCPADDTSTPINTNTRSHQPPTST